MSHCEPTHILGLGVSDWVILIIGAITGLIVTVLFQWLISLRRKWLLNTAYAGQWVRKGMSEYHLTPEEWRLANPQVFDKVVDISVRTGRSIHVRVDYGKRRGVTEAVIELHGDGMTSGEGPYTYTREGDDCYGNAGWYSMHRLSEGKLHVYFTGRYPENTANGYEVWERK